MELIWMALQAMADAQGALDFTKAIVRVVGDNPSPCIATINPDTCEIILRGEGVRDFIYSNISEFSDESIEIKISLTENSATLYFKDVNSLLTKYQLNQRFSDTKKPSSILKSQKEPELLNFLPFEYQITEFSGSFVGSPILKNESQSLQDIMFEIKRVLSSEFLSIQDCLLEITSILNWQISSLDDSDYEALKTNLDELLTNGFNLNKNQRKAFWEKKEFLREKRLGNKFQREDYFKKQRQFKQYINEGSAYIERTKKLEEEKEEYLLLSLKRLNELTGEEINRLAYLRTQMMVNGISIKEC